MVVLLTEREEEGHVRGKYGLVFLLWKGNIHPTTYNSIKVINLFLGVIHGGLTELAETECAPNYQEYATSLRSFQYSCSH